MNGFIRARCCPRRCEFKGVFPPVYTASIYAGERSGNLVEVITRYIQYEKTIVGVRKRFLNSLIYPAFLIVLSMVMVGVIMTYVIPQFAELYSGLNTPLAGLDAYLDRGFERDAGQFDLIVPLLIGGIVALRFGWARRAAARWLDELKLKAPIVGNLWTMFSMAQLSRTLATLLQGGTPLLSALQVGAGRVGQSSLSRIPSAQRSVRSAREGRCRTAWRRRGHFPDLAMEMIRVGEQTGSLPEMLNHVADYYDEDVNIRSAALLSWVEPVILIFVAMFIALILISLYLPIFSIRGSMQK